jgi:hypothetical protein
MSDIVYKCKLCGCIGEKDDFFHCSESSWFNTSKKYIHYECVKENECKLRRSDYEKEKYKQQIEKNKKYEEKLKENEKYKDMTKEEAFEEKYNIDFEELIYSKEQYRDNSERYEDKDGNKYKWDRKNNIWEKL